MELLAQIATLSLSEEELEVRTFRTFIRKQLANDPLANCLGFMWSD